MDTTSHTTNLSDSSLIALLAEEVGTPFTFVQGAASGIGLDYPALRRLLRSGSLVRVGRGRYAIVELPVAQSPDPLHIATAPFVGEPHYVSWWAALARHGLSEQDPLTIAVAVRERRHRDRVVGSLRVRAIMQGPRRFYGAMRLGPVRIATPEKAIVDSLDRPDLAGGLGEVVKALASDGYDSVKLLATASRYPSRATIARLGYLLEALDRGDADALQRHVRRKSEPVLLDVAGAHDSAVDQRWRIVANVRRERLLYWASR